MLVRWMIEFAPIVVSLVQKSYATGGERSPTAAIQDVHGLLQWISPAAAPSSSRADFEQEKRHQQQLAAYHRETQLKLAAMQRETALKLPEIHKILESWPLRLYPSQILESQVGQSFQPLRIFLAPPQVQFDQLHRSKQPHLNIETCLAEGLRTFLNQHYSLQSPVRPTEFLAGAWESKRFHSESSIKALFGMLKSEPTLILESEIDGDCLNFRIAYWGVAQESYYYKTIARLPYRKQIQDAVKARALAWKQTRDQLIALGVDETEINQIGGDNVENLKLLEKEENWKAKGIDTTQLSFNYSVSRADVEQFCHFLVDCHCLVAAWIADIYHLIYRDIPPLLPELLPRLTERLKESDLVGAIATGYQQVYQALEEERRYWLPELALQLAQSLLHLPSRAWSQEQIEISLQAWLELHKIPLLPGEDPLQAMRPALTPADRAYLEQLKSCWAALGNEQRALQVQDMLDQIGGSVADPAHPGTPLLLLPSGDRPGRKLTHHLEKITVFSTLTGYCGKPSALAVGGHGQILVSADQDNRIKVWDIATGQLITTLSGHTQAVSSVAISLDGQWVASSSPHCPKGNLKIWHLPTGRLVYSSAGHHKPVRLVAIAADNRTLISASHKVKLWHLPANNSGQDFSIERFCTLWHTAPVSTALLSPQGQWLVSGSTNGKIKLWNPHTGEPLRTLQGHQGPVTGLQMSSDGQTLISSSADQTIKFWDLKTGNVQRILKGHTGSVNAIALSADGQWLVSGSADQTIKIWHGLTGELFHTLRGHSASVSAIALTPDQQTLISGSADHTIKIWRVVI